MANIDKKEVYRTFEVFYPPTEKKLMEVRVINPNSKADIWSGYFYDYERAWAELSRFDNGNYNFYFPFNTIDCRCYSMAQRDKLMKGAETTKDKDITTRDWVLIDIDTEKGHLKISSTDKEWNDARMKAHQVRNYLKSSGFSDPVVCSSGNGLHLLYKIAHWANTDENTRLVERFLLSLSAMFSDAKAEVDKKVFNAARITKFYGTVAHKGVDCAERPHRLSRFLLVPDEILTTDKQYFEKVADILPDARESSTSRNFVRNFDDFDIDYFIKRHNIAVASDTMDGDVRKIVLAKCPFDESHSAPDSAIFVMKNGSIGFTCFHNSCSQYTWKDLRLKYEPNAYDKKDYQEFKYKQRYYGMYQGDAPFVPLKETEEKGKKWLSLSEVHMKSMGEYVAIPTGYYGLDKALMGFLLGEVTLLSGNNSSGKSSWMNCVLLNAVQRGFKVGVWSGELPPHKMKEWIFQNAAGVAHVSKIPQYENVYDVDKKVVPNIGAWLDDKLFLYNNDYGNKWEQILSDMEEIIEQKKVQLIVCDNLMALNIDGKGKDNNERQKQFVLDVVALAKRKDVHIVIVCHPNKSAYQTLLRKENISGTSDLTNAVQRVLIIHRVNEDFKRRASEFFGKERAESYFEYDNVVEVCKDRSFGVQDFLFGMYYEQQTKRFKNSVSECLHYGWEDTYVTQSEKPSLFPQPKVVVNDDFFADAPKDVPY